MRFANDKGDLVLGSDRLAFVSYLTVLCGGPAARLLHREGPCANLNNLTLTGGESAGTDPYSLRSPLIGNEEDLESTKRSCIVLKAEFGQAFERSDIQARQGKWTKP